MNHNFKKLLSALGFLAYVFYLGFVCVGGPFFIYGMHGFWFMLPIVFMLAYLNKILKFIFYFMTNDQDEHRKDPYNTL